MGSDHYCLRWNNHQNNLLGVFSELLQEESLVDVTLACSEGHSIRAHKVVLSACSSYFKSLFVDHPSRHPIIILKDVCFPELRTLIEFMYRGEVNVEYCRLSTLLKTAESLQVKGLAEMTHLRSNFSPPEIIDAAPEIRDPTPHPPTSHEEHPLSQQTPVISQPTVIAQPIPLMKRRSRSPDDNEQIPEIRRPRLRLPIPTSPPLQNPYHPDTSSNFADDRRSLSPDPEPDIDQDDDVSSVQSGPSDMTIGGSRITSPQCLKVIPGPSNLGPVQKAPLSLKKEPVDWERERAEERNSGGRTTPEYSSGSSSRHLPDTVTSPIESVYSLALSHQFGVIPNTSAAAIVTTGSSTTGSASSAFDQLSTCSGRSSATTPFLFSPFHTIPVIPPPFIPGESLSLYSFFQQRNLLAVPYSSPNDISPRAFIKCAICLAAFPSGWLLEQHTILQHSGQTQRKSQNSSSSSDKNEEKPFQCDQCGQSYRYRSAYVKHREQNHRARLPADKLFTCDICGMQFRYLKSFKKHRLNHSLEMIHPNPNNSTTSGSSRKDNIKRSTPPTHTSDDSTPITPEDEEEEDEHIDLDDDQPTTGGVVSESQVSSSNEVGGNVARNNNNNNNNNNSNTTADEESKEEVVDSVSLALNGGEPTLYNLLRYPERRERQLFACSFCSKVVRSKENLKLHVRKHTGERPFACMFCGRAFGGKSDLTRHVRIHTGERPYHCETCGKCFARADYLSKHLTTHSHHPTRALSNSD